MLRCSEFLKERESWGDEVASLEKKLRRIFSKSVSGKINEHGELLQKKLPVLVLVR
jgi:hypothetical protein